MGFLDSNKKKKIFYVTSRGASAKSFLIRHFEQLTDHGFEVYLACSDDAEGRAAASKANIKHLPIPLKSDISIFSDLLAVFRLCMLIRRYRPDAVHGHMSKAALASTLAATLCRVPIRIYHNHGMACFSAKGKTRILLIAIEKITCLLATDVIFCGESTKHAALDLKICRPSKACVLGAGTISGVNTDVFSPQNANLSASKLLNDVKYLLEDKKYIAFVGRIVAHKGIDTLIDAWRMVPLEIKSNHSLVFAGAHASDALYERLDALVQEDPSVHYLGRIDNIVGLYGLLDILLLPSWHEGFPYSVLEAQACGVPAIVSDVTGNRDAVVDRKTGTLIPVDSAESLANAIKALLAHPSELQDMRVHARQRVVDEYGEALVLENLIEFYNTKMIA